MLTLYPKNHYVQVDHAVVASLFRDSNGKETVAASHRQLRGYLVNIFGDAVRELSTADGGSNRVRSSTSFIKIAALFNYLSYKNSLLY